MNSDGRNYNRLVTGFIECKGSESSAVCRAGEVVAFATNAAVAMYKAGIAINDIVIPFVTLTGTHVRSLQLSRCLSPAFPQCVS